jgi:hypothetical protein
VLLGEVADQLLDDHGLADAGATEQTHLAALGVGGEQVDHLDPGLEHLGGRRQLLDSGRIAVNRPALDVVRQRVAQVDRFSEQVEDPPQRRTTDRDGDWCPGVDHFGAPRQPVGGIERHSPHAIVAEMLLDLADQPLVGRGSDVLVLFGAGRLGPADLDRVVDLGQLVGEDGLDHDALDLLDPPDVFGALLAAGRGFFGNSHFGLQSRV